MQEQSEALDILDRLREELNVSRGGFFSKKPRALDLWAIHIRDIGGTSMDPPG